MNVSSSTQAHYTNITNTIGISNTLKGEHYILDNLNEETNQLLNTALEGKSDQDKWMIKLSLDVALKKANIDNNTVGDTSEDTIAKNLQGYIDSRKDLPMDMLGEERIAKQLLESYKKSNTYLAAQTKEETLKSDFLNAIYSKKSIASASALTKESIQNKVNKYAESLMQNRSDTPESKLEISKMLNEFKKELLTEYKESLEGVKDGNLSLEQQATIKVLMDENSQEASNLEKLLATAEIAKKEEIAASEATAEVSQTHATGRMAEMQEKYKDVYTPMPETYSKAGEDLQWQKIYEAYPNYITPNELFKMVSKVYTEEYGEKPIQLGDKLTQKQEDEQKAAADKVFQWAYEIYGGKEGFTKMTNDVYEIQKKYPVNYMAKDGDVKNATELTRFYNAAVYEGLESGKTIDEAKKAAGEARSAFMDMDAAIRKTDPMFKGTDILYNNGKSFLQTLQDEREVNWDTKWTWDLREYGIQGDWHWLNIYDNQNKMTDEIHKKIDQYNFMLDNKDLMAKANEKLNPDDRNQIDYYEKYINEFMPAAELALKVFDNYKIYD
ncbi:MAG: hypothetical protein WC656_06760 [Sulfurimonas sp.]|jgi:hypothetical protein